jgi:hypothetical protein
VDAAGIGFEPVPGVTVDISVSGANTVSGSCLYSNWGNCEFNYAGVNPGTDLITAKAVVDGTEVVATATNEWVVPPPNDDFSDAIPVPAFPFETDLMMTGATFEEDEPVCGLGGSVWFSFTPAQTAYISVETSTRSSYMGLGAYRGSALGGLEQLACEGFPYTGKLALEAGLAPSADDLAMENYLGFQAQGGQTYYIQVSTFDLIPDLGTISIDFATPGDANCSGNLNALDALEVLRKNVGLASAACVGNGDMNCDSQVNAIDALMILRVVALISEAPGSCLPG